MTLNRSIASIWIAFILLVSGFVIAEYRFLKNQSSTKVVKPVCGSVVQGLKKSVFDYSAFKDQSE